MKNLAFAVVTALALLGFGCSGSPDQVVTGRIAPGFPSQVTEVRVVHQGAVIASAPVAADGTFSLAFQPSSGLALQTVGAGKSGVVFPRQSGSGFTLKTTFAARAGSAPFDLGAVRYVGSASSTPIVFHNGPASQTECHDGVDANGATCIDDDDDADDGTCEADDDGEDEAAEQESDTDDSLAHEGDAVAEHNFPADGCHDDDDDDGADADD